MQEIRVNMGTGEVLVRVDPENRPSRDELAEAIRRAGFTLAGIDLDR